MKKIFKLSLIVLLVCLSLPITVKATNGESQQNIYIPKEEVREGNVYLIGQNITVDGEIKGDLIAVANLITVNGHVGGDIITAGSTLNVNGQVDGNIRALGNQINLNSSVGKNITLVAAVLNYGQSASTGGDLVVMASQLNLSGSVIGHLYAGGDLINIDGKIGKGADLRLGGTAKTPLNISNEAIINGDLNYYSKNAANITNRAAISGQLNHKEIGGQKSPLLAWFWGRLYALFAALICGLVLITLLKKKWPQFKKLSENKVGRNFGIGALILFLSPLAALILAITFIGLPLAAIIIAVWLIVIYLAKILVAVLFGGWLENKLFKKEDPGLFRPLVLGVLAAWIVFSIPFIGWLISLAATIFGLGLIYLIKKEEYV